MNEEPQLPGQEDSDDFDRELVAWVTGHTDQWRDHRDTNYRDLWLEYERIWRGVWSSEDKTRESERSRLISPATQQAIETRHAEIMEAIMGSGEFFDIQDDIKDPQKLDIDQLKAQLHEDFKLNGVKKAVDQIVLMGEIYGTGIGEIIVKEDDTYKPSTQPIPGLKGQAAYGVMEGKRTCVKPVPVNPKNFLIDPNATCIEEALGVGIEKYVSIHKIVEGMESGKYRKVATGTLYSDDKLEATQETSDFQEGKVKLLTYYGLVPKDILQKIKDEDVEELFPEHTEENKYSGLVEAIIVIANDGVLLKAEENPYMMKDRPVIAYQADTVPGRFWGRGTVEKAYNMQKAIDATLRADMDSRALTTAPMVALDATRLPRGAKFEVKPGKALLTNGNPAEILMPFSFGQHKQENAMAAQNFERMLLQATGTVDSAGMPSQVGGDAGMGGMSMAMAGIIKKYKRTLTNFQEDFLIPFVNKAAWRYMQFDPDRYPSTDLTFVPTGCLGILAREYEQAMLTNLLKTLGPDTPVLPLIMSGIIQNSSLANRGELLEALQKMSQPNPEQQQAQQASQALQMQLLQAQVKETQAKAQKASTEAQVAPMVAKAKIIAALSNNLDEDNEGKDFERRTKLAELMLQERDIDSNERIAFAQIQASKEKNSTKST
jgi:hypothetical protein